MLQRRNLEGLSSMGQAITVERTLQLQAAVNSKSPIQKYFNELRALRFCE
jgi:hypothetical protein